MANLRKIQLLDAVQGSHFLAIQSTMDIFQRHNPNLAHSKIEMMREGNSVIVILANQDDLANTQSEKFLGVSLESKEELSSQYLSRLMLHRDQTQFMAQIQGNSFIAIKKAVEVFQRHNPNLMLYHIKVVRENDSVWVIFADKNRPTGILGSLGKPRFGFEVELNFQEMTVIKYYFVR
jgi:hypothetical protein